jgi:hypothetical protein
VYSVEDPGRKFSLTEHDAVFSIPRRPRRLNMLAIDLKMQI